MCRLKGSRLCPGTICHGTNFRGPQLQCRILYFRGGVKVMSLSTLQWAALAYSTVSTVLADSTILVTSCRMQRSFLSYLPLITCNASKLLQSPEEEYSVVLHVRRNESRNGVVVHAKCNPCLILLQSWKSLSIERRCEYPGESELVTRSISLSS